MKKNWLRLWVFSLLVVASFGSISDAQSQDVFREIDQVKKDMSDLRNELNDLKNQFYGLRQSILRSVASQDQRAPAAGAAQRPGHVRPRGRGRRRRQHAAARQDRHDHPRATGRPPSSSRSTASTRMRLADAAQLSQPRRRDAGGPLHRGARQDRRTACASAHAGELATAHFVAFTAQTRMSGVDLAGGRADPQGRCDRGDDVGARQRRSPDRTRSAPSSTRIADRGRHAARRRGRGRRTRRPGCSASSTSRTSSRRACASGSTRCAGWASAPS